MKRERVQDFAAEWSPKCDAPSPRARAHGGLCVAGDAARACAGPGRRAVRPALRGGARGGGGEGGAATAGAQTAPRTWRARRLLYNMETNPAPRAVVAELVDMTDADMRAGTVLEQLEQIEEHRRVA